MLRFVFTVVLLLGLAFDAGASSITLGVRGGSSVPNLRDRGSNDLSSGWSSRVAPFFGVVSDVGLTRALSVMVEVNYAAQGGKRDGMQPVITDVSALGVPPDVTVYGNFKNVAKLDYVEIPVLARYHFTRDRRVSVGFGPFFGLLLSAKTETSGVSPVYMDKQGTQPVSPPVDFSATTDNKSDLHTFNWGLQTGVGVEQPFGRGWLDFELRGGIGLSNVQKDTATNGKNGTGNVVVALGYVVPIGHP